MATAAQYETAIETRATEGFAEEEDLESQLAYENLKKRREARKRKRIIVGAIVAALALGGGVYHFVSQQQAAADADASLDPLSLTTTITKGDFTTSVTANGATEPLNSTVVTPEVEGIIEGLQVEVGQQVVQGDVLFSVKNDKLDSAVREAEDQLVSSERARDRAIVSLNKANSAVDDAYRARQAAWDEASASGDWENYNEDELNSTIASAEDNRDSANDSLVDADEAVDKARSSLEEARAEADKRTVRAPVSGTIISMSAKEGASTSGSGEGTSTEPLVQIVDLSQMKVTVQVNEVDIAAIKEGQKATAAFSALPDLTLDAEVTRIASVASGSGEGSGVVTYAVDLLIPQPDKALKPGMTANVTIIIESVPDTLLVSSAAVGEDDKGKYVIVVDDAETGQMHRAAVEVVAANSSEVAITGDVWSGDAVLLDPTSVSLDDDEEEGEFVGREDGEFTVPEDYESLKEDASEDDDGLSDMADVDSADSDDSSGKLEVEA